MLQELSIRNFAIIDELALSLEEGLTVLTGETGAGKSIIIDAVQLLVGGRGSSEFVRHGEKKAEIEGIFTIEKGHPCYLKCADLGIDIEDGMILLKRDISQTGKSACRINGKLVTIAILREVGATLIDVHGQHESQELMDENRHLNLLDQFGGQEIKPAKAAYSELYEEYEAVQRQIRALSENEQQMAHRLDLLQFQFNEIEQAALEIEEDSQLLEEKSRLVNFERLFSSLQTAYDSLQGEQKGLDWTGLAMSNIEDAAEIDATLAPTSESIANSFYLLEEASNSIRHQLDALEYDPDRLQVIDDRLNEINQLKRKYGNSITEIVQFAATIEEEIESITNRESTIKDLEKRRASITEDLSLEADNLSSVRKKWAQMLTDEIHGQLQALHMNKAVFEVYFHGAQGSAGERQLNFKKDGTDSVEFYISTNPGEPLKPLTKVASGGEISRIMLALKTIFSKHQGITSIIFDEVDTGVSGRVAQAIAEKIYAVSVHSQVLCISHLPQVAAISDRHLFISKEVKNDRTITHVLPLEEKDRVQEISRMISGVEITDLTLSHAKELLDLAHSIKKTTV
ncbi:DNA repair protein RecN [Jeotgalibacillus proteolyticus]|uniref:DNA repair protein RecN n=1 Tax=Jeotgalibacillus proteolyticus TaxID=2082395 RepID=A0A2S5GER0_9BACL|nr:DNA repair protein RecN [Jeotgalibacillus proteolyticus]PPA71363.1 DNA repair protein RecN [Jeotgalibacillus proteolyticus]